MNCATGDVVLSPQRITAQGQRRGATTTNLRRIDRLVKEAIPKKSDLKATFFAREAFQRAATLGSPPDHRVASPPPVGGRCKKNLELTGLLERAKGLEPSKPKRRNHRQHADLRENVVRFREVRGSIRLPSRAATSPLAPSSSPPSWQMGANSGAVLRGVVRYRPRALPARHTGDSASSETGWQETFGDLTNATLLGAMTERVAATTQRGEGGAEAFVEALEQQLTRLRKVAWLVVAGGGPQCPSDGR